jgi:hypothetical protein
MPEAVNYPCMTSPGAILIVIMSSLESTKFF